ncbi:MAG: TonB-dependent receptor [Ignavibacteriaceae bacterium]
MRDASSGESLPLANISLTDNSRGASTDMNGRYELTLPPGNYEMLISYIGYKTERISVEVNDKDINLDLRLTSTGVLLQEVSVYSARENESQSISSLSLQSKEMEEMSSVFPDVFRSIQALPGIAANNEFSGKFNVRGGNNDENLVLVNGTQVYEPFHIKYAENVSLGIFNMDLMKKVNLMTGGFSAQYGDRLSSVLNIEYREGNRLNHTGSATLSLVNVDAYFEGPITSKASYIIGLRKSYLEYVMEIVDVDDETGTPSFYDIQGVISYSLSDIDKLQFKFIHAGDDYAGGPYIDNISRDRGLWLSNTQFSPGWENINNFDEEKAEYFSNMYELQSTVFLSGSAFLNSSLSYYHQLDSENDYENNTYNLQTNDNRFFYRNNFQYFYDYDLTIKTIEAKTSLDLKINPFYDIKTGLSYINIDFNENLIENEWGSETHNLNQFRDTITFIDEEDPPQNTKAKSFKFAGFAENVFQLSDNFIVNAGVRTDYYNFNKEWTVSPRLSASYRFENGINLRAAWGHYYQSPIYRQMAYSTASDTNTQSQKAEHYILGVEKKFILNGSTSNTFTIKLEGYYKNYSDLISSERTNDGNIRYSRKNDSKGYAAGVDVYAALKLNSYYGWISYGLLVAREDLLSDTAGEFPRYTDQRHTLSLINDFDLGKQWNLNLRFTYGSGFAYTPSTAVLNTQLNRYEWVKGEMNSEHLPAYVRTDIRISKGFSFFGLPAKAFLDVSNLLNSDNIYAYRYTFTDDGYPMRKTINLWPIVPSIGLTVNF